MRTVALICARGGSKGVPGKNIRPLLGKPLIAWTIEQAQAVRRIDRIIVSTDSEEIASVARAAGADVPFMRPSDLAGDDSPEWHVWRHALRYLEEHEGAYPDALVVLPATSPLRAPADVERCLDEYDGNSADIVITVTDAHRSPYFNMVTVRDGFARLVIPPDHPVRNRQQAPPVFDMTTVAYVVRPQAVFAHDGLFEGTVRTVHVPAERALDIDTNLDFAMAECLMRCERRADTKTVAASLSLEGRCALVTGAAGHIGSVISHTLAELGADLILVDRATAGYGSAIENIRKCWGVEVKTLSCDLERDTERAELIDAVLAQGGRLDVLVNNAAFVGTSGLEGWVADFQEQTLDTWRRALEVNLTAAFDLSKGFARLLGENRTGSIINIGSIYGRFAPDHRLYEGTPLGTPAAYAASKGGLIQLTRWLASTLAPQVRVNAISPGGVFRNQPAAFVERYESRTPMGRMASEEDLRGAVVYLATGLSSYVTGENLAVDGGWGIW